MALEEAESKAELIANTLGLKIIAFLSVSESVYCPYSPYNGFIEATFNVTPDLTHIIECILSLSVSVQVALIFE